MSGVNTEATTQALVERNTSHVFGSGHADYVAAARNILNDPNNPNVLSYVAGQAVLPEAQRNKLDTYTFTHIDRTGTRVPLDPNRATEAAKANTTLEIIMKGDVTAIQGELTKPEVMTMMRSVIDSDDVLKATFNSLSAAEQRDFMVNVLRDKTTRDRITGQLAKLYAPSAQEGFDDNIGQLDREHEELKKRLADLQTERTKVNQAVDDDRGELEQFQSKVTGGGTVTTGGGAKETAVWEQQRAASESMATTAQSRLQSFDQQIRDLLQTQGAILATYQDPMSESRIDTFTSKSNNQVVQQVNTGKKPVSNESTKARLNRIEDQLKDLRQKREDAEKELKTALQQQSEAKTRLAALSSRETTLKENLGKNEVRLEELNRQIRELETSSIPGKQAELEKARQARSTLEAERLAQLQHVLPEAFANTLNEHRMQILRTQSDVEKKRAETASEGREKDVANSVFNLFRTNTGAIDWRGGPNSVDTVFALWRAEGVDAVMRERVFRKGTMTSDEAAAQVATYKKENPAGYDQLANALQEKIIRHRTVLPKVNHGRFRNRGSEPLSENERNDIANRIRSDAMLRTNLSTMLQNSAEAQQLFASANGGRPFDANRDMYDQVRGMNPGAMMALLALLFGMGIMKGATAQTP